MEEQHSFGNLLRRYRISRHLSQEALAERARLSPHAISALERGVRSAPRLSTVNLLAKALELTATERVQFTAAARGQQPFLSDPLAFRLPEELTRLVGREVETAAITSLLRGNEIRMLTLIGPPGVGKTRLAQHVAGQLLDHFEDGIFFLPFAPVRQPELVVPLMAQMLGLHDAGSQPLIETVRDHLSTKHILLVLDNFEQLVEAAPQLSDLLKTCPRLTLLVTSRAALRVRGEQEFPVPLLTFPKPGELPPVEDLTHYSAIALFVQCAKAVKRDFELTAANAPLVVDICRHLEGLPLSLEFAARHLKLLSLHALLTNLERRLDFLAHGARDLPQRQQTLRGAIAWSYGLLSTDEQRAFCSLAVFAGGATLEALGAMLNLSEREALKQVIALVEHSLVQPQEGVWGNARFSMLETIREYGIEQLAANGQLFHAQRCHATYFLEFAERAVVHVRGWEQVTWMERMNQEDNNLRAALAWGLRTEQELERAAYLAVVLASFWLLAGHFDEGRKWLTEVIARVEATIPASRHLGWLLAWAGLLAFQQGDGQQALALSERSVVISQQRGEMGAQALALRTLGMVARARGEHERALPLYRESLTLYQEREDRCGMAWVLSNLGFLFLTQADFGQADALFQQSLREAWQVGEVPGYGWALVGLGELAQAQVDLKRAEALYTVALAIFQESGDICSCSSLLMRLAQLAEQQGNDEQAGAAFRRGLMLARTVGHQERTALCLKGMERHSQGSRGVTQILWPYGEAGMEHAGDIVHALRAARKEGKFPELPFLLSQAQVAVD